MLNRCKVLIKDSYISRLIFEKELGFVEKRDKQIIRRISYFVSMSTFIVLYNNFELINVIIAIIIIPLLTWLIYFVWKLLDPSPRSSRNSVVVTLDDYVLYNKIKVGLVNRSLEDNDSIRLLFDVGLNKEDLEDLAGHIAVSVKNMIEEGGIDFSEEEEFFDLMLEVLMNRIVVNKYLEYKEFGKSHEKQYELIRSISDAIIIVMNSKKGLSFLEKVLGRNEDQTID
jgi:hypothetical protein